MTLTNKACESAKPKDKSYKLADGGGLYLEIMPNGRKHWRLKYRFLGKENRLAFGAYPSFSMREARELREKAKKLLAQGIDPAFVRKEQKRQEQIAANNTVEAIVREWHEHQRERWTAQTARYVLNRIEVDVFPFLGRMPISQITAPQLLDVMKKVEKRGAQEVARRLLQSCSQVFRFAIVTGRAERNPATDLQGALRPMKHGHYW